MEKNESGKRLSTFIQARELLQKDVAQDLGVSAQYVNQMCTGKAAIGKKTAFRLQELFGVRAAWLLLGEGNMCADGDELPAVKSSTTGIPYYNVDFHLGFSLLANDQTLNPEYLIDFPPCNNCDCWVNAHGDSMYPTINGGDIVALRRVYDISYLINGEIYAIVTSNGLRTIKRILDQGDTFSLVADNPAYGSQTIPKDLVTHVYHVRGIIKMF